jgi:hypothetical protein
MHLQITQLRCRILATNGMNGRRRWPLAAASLYTRSPESSRRALVADQTDLLATPNTDASLLADAVTLSTYSAPTTDYRAG